MPVVPSSAFAAHRLPAALASIGLLALVIEHAVAFPFPEQPAGPAALISAASQHLVLSEVMTGGASASDEFIELYNPTSATLPLEGLEVVYVTASGATVTRKAAWAEGATGMPAGTHLLIANAAGVFGGIADVAYANGLAATGGSVALRVQGQPPAIDAAGWGNAASTWLETRPAPAPATGSSLERLPGGSSGSGQDTDDNLVDFVIQPVPDPQNSGSAPIVLATPTPTPSESGSESASPTPTPDVTASPTVEPTMQPTASETPVLTPSPSESPSATDTPTPSLTPIPTPPPTPSPTPTPTPAPISIAEARSLPDGAEVLVEGVALSAADFTDGGGYLVDGTAGIAVLLSDGTFSRGQLLRVAGTVDDRYAQRTIRSSAAQVVILGTASEPLPVDAETGSIGEAFEGQLVELTGVISSSATTLSTGVAWDLDDGSGPIRVVIGTATGIDTTAWGRGVGLTVVGVVGQRDSSGSGTTGFRVQPRNAADIIAVEPAATPSPTPSPTPEPTPTSAASASPTPTASPSAYATPTAVPLVSIGEARAAATGTHLRIRGVVTAQSGLLEVGSAVVQDSTGGMLVRLGSTAGSLSLGQFVELEGIRSTKAGMLSLRVTKPPLRLGTLGAPTPTRRATGALGEADEARLVITRGVVSSPVSRPRGGAVSFAIDDGSGPVRVSISARSGISTGSIRRGAWLELRGVLGQETTGSAPLRGYRLWPRMRGDLREIAAPVAGTGAGTPCCTSSGPSDGQQGAGGLLPGSVQGEIVRPGPGLAPTLTRAHPTLPPGPPVMTTHVEAATGAPATPRGAALLVAGIGLTSLAALAAWFARRRGHPLDDGTDVAAAPGELQTEGETPGPRLALLRIDEADAQEERRILPPT